jgi:chemotaxis protein MotB
VILPTFTRPHASPAGSAWLVTFADLIALLLAFFVMMYATQRVEQGNWQAMVESLSRSFKVDKTDVAIERSADRNVQSVKIHSGADLGYLESLIVGVRDSQPLLTGMMVRRRQDRLIISFPGELLFPPGRADPVAGAKRRVLLLTDILRNLPNRLQVFGHADPRAASGLFFGSNWELSLARADAVATMMGNAGYDRAIDAFGLSDSRYAEIPAAASTKRRLALARRVDIVIRNRLAER